MTVSMYMYFSAEVFCHNGLSREFIVQFKICKLFLSVITIVVLDRIIEEISIITLLQFNKKVMQALKQYKM